MQTLKEYYEDPENIRKLTESFRNMTLGELKAIGSAKKLGLSYIDNFLITADTDPDLREFLTVKQLMRLFDDSRRDPRFSNRTNNPPFTSEENLRYLENLLCRFFYNVYGESYTVKRFLYIPVKNFFKTVCGRENSKDERELIGFLMKDEKESKFKPEDITIFDILKECNLEISKSWVPTCWSLEDYSEKINRACDIFGRLFVKYLADDKPVPEYEIAIEV